MGAWGTGLFSDDTACDVCDDYRDMLGDGLSGSEATQRLVVKWEDTINDPDEGPVFWLALAATQWKLGRLEELVKSKALEVIRSGQDLLRWEDDKKSIQKRKLVLEKLEQQLLSPQGPIKKIPKLFKDSTEFRRGDAVSYRLQSGKYIILRVLGTRSDKGGTSPVFEVCDWIGACVPTHKEISNLPIKTLGGIGGSKLSICAAKKNEYPVDRLQIITRGLSLTQNEKAPSSLVLWRKLDELLEKYYGFGS
jgi:hypothetical protein